MIPLRKMSNISEIRFVRMPYNIYFFSYQPVELIGIFIPYIKPDTFFSLEGILVCIKLGIFLWKLASKQ